MISNMLCLYLCHGMILHKNYHNKIQGRQPYLYANKSTRISTSHPRLTVDSQQNWEYIPIYIQNIGI